MLHKNSPIKIHCSSSRKSHLFSLNMNTTHILESTREKKITHVTEIHLKYAK